MDGLRIDVRPVPMPTCKSHHESSQPAAIGGGWGLIEQLLESGVISGRMTINTARSIREEIRQCIKDQSERDAQGGASI
jgi:hypothetical protein